MSGHFGGTVKAVVKVTGWPCPLWGHQRGSGSLCPLNTMALLWPPTLGALSAGFGRRTKDPLALPPASSAPLLTRHLGKGAATSDPGPARAHTLCKFKSQGPSGPPSHR